MSLRLSAALAAVAELHDLPQLLAALGHEPLWQELPPLAGVRHAATIGRRGAFTWLGIEADSAAVEAARRALRLLGTKGRLSGVVAFYPGGREIAIATAFERPEVLRLSLDAPDPVGLACLERLRASGEGTAAAYAARAADALAGRGAGREFFRQFRTTLDAMSDAIDRASGPNGPRDPAARRNLALLQLTRVLFLYFVQSKGWLDGRPDFLARSVDDCLARGHRLHRDFLRPLFFGTLNIPVADRSAAVRRFGKIPFLNGGLFEPHPLERRFRFTLPDLEWRDAFDHLFERFHFTVSEGAPDGSAIAPDMLGHVFEGVMEPADRKASGTFYTPAVLVRLVVDAGINALVASRLGCSDADASRRLAAADPAALSLLADVTVLDPACGSGAFLLGALERLAAFRALSGESPTDARRAVLQRNLFGVDLDAMAVRLAELRLWLAVVAEDPAVAAGAVRPLPNLDCLVRQGDSLIEPHGAGSGIDPGIASQIGTLRARLVTAAGREKRPIMTALRQVELQAAVSGSEAHERRLRHAVAELIEAARAPSLFGDRPRLTAGARARIKALRAELRETRSVCRRMRRSGEVPWFHYASHFADVMERGGFDLVVGNPPWVRAEDLPMLLRERLVARYRWWRASYGLAERAGARTGGFAHQPDLSVAFLERAHELAAPGAAVSLLVPSKIAAAGYAGIVRGALATTATIHAVADLAGDRRGTFAATVYPMALVTTNRRPRESHCVRASLDAAIPATTRQRDLGAEPWIIGADAVAAIIQRLRSALPALGDRFRCRLGVKTGADRLFLDAVGIEPELMRPVVRGRDVNPFRVECCRQILWTHDEHGAPLASLPTRAAAHVARHDAALRGRTDYAGGPPWTLFRATGAVGAHRVIWPDLSRNLTAVALTGPGARFVPLNTCYLVATRSAAEAHALAAWLNSTWLRGFARAIAPPASGGYARFGASIVGRLPLPVGFDEPALTELGEAGAAGSNVTERVDDHVARLLDLSRDDRFALAQAAGGGAHDRR